MLALHLALALHLHLALALAPTLSPHYRSSMARRLEVERNGKSHISDDYVVGVIDG